MSYCLINFSAENKDCCSVINLESNGNIPFNIKRVYYIYGTSKDAIRGKHSHRKLQQVIFCPSGSCDFTVDDGSQRQTFHFNSPEQGLLISGNVWREFTNFSPDCVVMVLASEIYDETDYIRDYSQFKKEI